MGNTNNNHNKNFDVSRTLFIAEQNVSFLSHFLPDFIVQYYSYLLLAYARTVYAILILN